MDTIRLNFFILIYLLGCEINGIEPEKERLRGLDNDALFSLAEFHSVAALTAAALAPFLGDRELFDEAHAEKWKSARGSALRRAVLYNAETASICDFFEKNGIWYMLLKGSVLQNYYPEFGLREMVDVDILFDQSRAKEVHDFMKSQGYKVVYYKKTHHDVYEKPPVFTYELHRTLCSELHEKLFAYYSNVKDKLIRVRPDKAEYKFSDDDFYIFNAAHACRHFSTGGTGLRTLLDIYICRKKMNLRQSYIQSELKRLGYLDTEQQLSGLAQQLFSKDAVLSGTADVDDCLLDFIMRSGSKGTFEHSMISSLKNDSGAGKNRKLGYIRKRIFLSEERLKNIYPFFYRHKAARPLLFVYRAFNGVFIKRKQLLNEYKLLKKIDDKSNN